MTVDLKNSIAKFEKMKILLYWSHKHCGYSVQSKSVQVDDTKDHVLNHSEPKRIKKAKQQN